MWSPLMWASWEGRKEVVKLLLDKGALLDEKDKYGKTALMQASYEGHMEVNPKPNPHPNLFPSPSPDPNP